MPVATVGCCVGFTVGRDVEAMVGIAVGDPRCTTCVGFGEKLGLTVGAAEKDGFGDMGTADGAGDGF